MILFAFMNVKTARQYNIMVIEYRVGIHRGVHNIIFYIRTLVNRVQKWLKFPVPSSRHR